MSGKKILLVVLLVLVIFLSVIIGMLWHMQHYQMIDFRFYPKDARTLDLREEEISIAHYNKIRRRMPDTEILWKVPFQNGRYSDDTRELTVTELTEKDAEAIAYFTRLETLDARGCSEYALLQMLQKTYPRLNVRYTLTVGGREYEQDAQVLYVDGITSEEIRLLQYLPQLAQVRLESGKTPEQLRALVGVCQQRDIPVQVIIGGRGYDASTTALKLQNITGEELNLLYFLTRLEEVSFVEPQADAQSLAAFAQSRPGMKCTVEKKILGVSCTSATRQLDLTAGISQAGALAYEKAKTASVQGERDKTTYLFAVNSKYPLADMTASTAQLIAQVEQALAYFPDVQEVLMCGCLLDNEAMAAFREARRNDYKVIWSVQLGDKMIARTDTPYIMPTKYHVYYFLDSDAVNLKYCEDMVCIDLGHMAVSKIDWVTNMPNLQYLVLAHTQVQYIEPIRGCKKLKFLELDWSPIKDYTPLKDCTALEDLNLGETFADFTPIGQMTWLKNLWMVGCSRGPAYRMTEALTNTKVVVSGSATVSGGWRNLENYFAMRDAMGMYYMEW